MPADGGAKNFLGHSKRSISNLYAFVDAQPVEGSGPGIHKDFCANNDGAHRASSGWGEVYADNRCHLTKPAASVYLYGNCDAEDLNATVDWTFNNTFFTPDGTIRVQCKDATWTLKQYQALGYDLLSTQTTAPSLDTLIK